MSQHSTSNTGGCEENRLTRSELLSLRNNSQLESGCHYTITNPSADGNLDVQEVTLHATNINTLGSQADILTSHDNEAWEGVYDIDSDNVIEVIDDLENKVITNASILTFPFGVSIVRDNYVNSDARIVYNGGTVEGNTFGSNSNITINSGSFTDNTIGTDATVISSATAFVRNHLEASSNTTINSGDFRENRVQGDATVNSSTTGDVDNNVFGTLSITNVSGAANVDTVIINQNANLTISGGALSDTSIGEDAQVTLISGSHYENVFGASTIFTQVGTGYVRYTTIEGTTSWINGNVNLSNVNSYVSTVNTTGSVGTISNSFLNRAYLQSLQNVPSLTIIDSTISNFATFTINNAARLYFYRSTATDGSRVLISSGSRIDMSHVNLDSYSYVQSTISGGIMTINYTNLSSLSYIRNLTSNTHNVDRCDVSSQSNIRFEGTSTNCRVYYSSASGGSTIYHNGSSNGCYIYYCTAASFGQIYTSNSTNARLYYNSVDSRGYIRSLNCTSGTHYMYYCNASASGFVQMNNAGGRMYSVSATSQSIVEKRGSGGNIYYSTFTAYYYAYITRTTGTSSGLYGMGRRSHTITAPTTIAPYNSGASWQNF